MWSIVDASHFTQYGVTRIMIKDFSLNNVNSLYSGAITIRMRTDMFTQQCNMNVDPSTYQVKFEFFTL